MRVVSRCFLIFSTLIVLASCQMQAPVKDPFERWNQKNLCALRRDGGCYPPVSIYALIANPEAYEGKSIVVQGYLGIDFGLVYLYPTRSSYEGMDMASSIQVIHDDFLEEKREQLMSRMWNHVSVYGKFSLEYDEPVIGKLRVGSIKPDGMPEYAFQRIMDRDSSEIYTIIRNIPEIDD